MATKSYCDFCKIEIEGAYATLTFKGITTGKPYNLLYAMLCDACEIDAILWLKEKMGKHED